MRNKISLEVVESKGDIRFLPFEQTISYNKNIGRMVLVWVGHSQNTPSRSLKVASCPVQNCPLKHSQGVTLSVAFQAGLFDEI
jgi:hypothetical protein